MPITSSAKKALRASRHKRVFNLSRKSEIKATTKQIRDLVKENRVLDAAKNLHLAYQALDKAVKTGLIKKNTAARKKSRLALSLRKAS